MDQNNPNNQNNSSFKFKADGKEVENVIKKMTEQFTNMTKIVDGLKKSFVDMAEKGVKGFGDYNKSVSTANDSVKKLTTESTKGFKGLNKTVEESAEKMTVMKKVVGDLGKVAGSLVGVFFSMQDALEVFAIGKTIVNGLRDSVVNLSGVVDKTVVLFGVMAATGIATQPIADLQGMLGAITLNKEAALDFNTNAIAAYTEFSAALTQVNTILRANKTELEENGKQIQALVNGPLKNAVSSVEALNGQYQVLSGGFSDAAESQEVLNASLQLSVVGYANAYDTAGLLVKTMRAYGFEAERASQTSAELLKIVELGITTVPELSQNFGQTATTAKQAGVGISELGAAVATLTSSGRSTPTSLTGIESLLRTIISKTPQAEKALADLSMEAGRAVRLDIQTIREKGLAQTLQDINEAAKGNASVLADILPDSLAYSTALALMANNSGTFLDNLEKMNGSTVEGFGENFEDVMADRQKRLEAIINRINELFIEFGRILAPFIEPAVAALESFSSILSSIPDPMKQFIGFMITTNLAVGQATSALGSLVKTLISVAFQYAQIRGPALAFEILQDKMSGRINTTVATMKDLILENKGYMAVIKQVIGLDQTHTLVQKENVIAAQKNNLAKKVEEINEAFNNLRATKGVDVVKEDLDSLTKASKKAADEIQKQLRLTNDPALTKEISENYNKIAADINATYGEEVVKQIETFIDGKKRESVEGEVLSKTINTETKAREKNFVQKVAEAAQDKFNSIFRKEEVVQKQATTAATVVENTVRKESAALKGAEVSSSALVVATKKLEADASGYVTITVKAETIAETENVAIEGVRSVVSGQVTKQKVLQAGAESSVTGAVAAQNVTLKANGILSILSTKLIAAKTLVVNAATLGWKGLTAAIALASKALLALATKVLAFMLTPLGLVVAGVAALAVGLVALWNAFAGAREVDKFTKSLNDLEESQRRNKEEYAALTDNIEEGYLATDKAAQGFNRLGGFARTLGGDLLDLSNTYVNIGKAVDETTDSTQALLDLQERAARTKINPYEQFQDRNAINDYFKEAVPLMKQQEQAILDNVVPAIGKLNDGYTLIDTANERLRNGFALTDQDLKDNARAFELSYGEITAQMEAYRAELEKEDVPEEVRQDRLNRIKDLQDLADAYKEAEERSRRLQKTQSQLNAVFRTNLKGTTLKDNVGFQQKQMEQQLLGGIDTTFGRVEAQVDENGKRIKSVYERIQEGTLENYDELTTGLNNSVESISSAFENGVISAEKAVESVIKIRDATIEKDIEGKKVNVNPLTNAERIELTKTAEEFLKVQEQRQLRSVALEGEYQATLRKERGISQQEYEDQLFANQEKELAIQADTIRQLIAMREKEGLDTTALKQDLESKLLQIRSATAEREEDLINREREKQERIADNRLEAYKQQEKIILNNIELADGQLQQEQKLLQSRASLAEAQENAVEAQLQMQLKTTGDITDRAAIETELAENRLKNLDRQQEVERLSLQTQNKLNESALRREEIGNRIAQQEAKIQKFKLEQEKLEAVREKRTEEELASIDLQLSALDEQSRFLAENASLIAEQRVQQVEINANAEAELNIRQGIARQQAELEVALSRQNEIAAQAEEFAKQAANYAKEQDLNAQKFIQKQEALTQTLEGQNKILDARRNILSAQQGYIESEFSVANDLAKTDKERRILAEDLAKKKFDILTATQRIERDSLEIQLKQNEAAQKRAEIENQIQQVQNQAAIAQAKAELAKTQANPQASQEEIRAAELGLQAQIETGAGLAFSGQLLQQQGVFQQQFADIQRYNLGLQQGAARQQGELEVANSLVNPTLRNVARNQLRNRVINGNIRGVADNVPIGGVNFAELQTPDFDQVRSQFLARQTEFGVGGNTGDKGRTAPSQTDLSNIRQPVLNQSTVQNVSTQRQQEGSNRNTATTPPSITIQNLQMTNEITIDNSIEGAELRNQVSNNAQQGVLDGIYAVATKIQQLRQTSQTT